MVKEGIERESEEESSEGSSERVSSAEHRSRALGRRRFAYRGWARER